MRTAVESWSTGRDPSVVLDRWRSVLSATHLPWTVALPSPEPGAAAFEATVQRWWIDDLALVDCTCGPCSGSRTRRDMAATDGEFVVVLINRAGRETVSQGSSEAGLRPGDAVVWDSGKAARFAVHEPLSKRSLLIPRAALDEVVGRSQPSGGVMLDGSAPATRLLTSYLDSLRSALPDLDPAAVGAARNATLELFAGALRAGADVPSSAVTRPALRAAMDRWIDRNLVGPVTSTGLARAHGVSVRTVNRIFNATGQTVGEVVRVRRLARAREDLTGTDHPVARIAHRYGFSDASHLSRSFKAHYGTSPSEYRKAGAPVHAPGVRIHGTGPATDETGVTAAPG